jgi:hypothetical protein
MSKDIEAGKHKGNDISLERIRVNPMDFNGSQNQLNKNIQKNDGGNTNLYLTLIEEKKLHFTLSKHVFNSHRREMTDELNQCVIDILKVKTNL